jgi:anti-anti-sigma factor
MQVTPEKIKNRLVLHATGRFDNAGSRVVAEALGQAMESGSHTVIIDMAGVDYLSSAGIRVLVTFSKRLLQLKGGLYLSSATDRISQLLEMTGLYSLLDVPPDEDENSPGLKTLLLDGWSLTARELDPEGKVIARTIGQNATTESGPQVPDVLPFPLETLAIGTGALGYDAGECTGRYGPFLAAGGYAAFRPGTDGSEPDFEEYAEAYIPRLHVLSAVTFTGSFSWGISFECDAAPPKFADLAGAFLDLAGAPAVAFVLAAECEVPHEGRVPAGRDAPSAAGPSSADGSRLCRVWIAGVAGRAGMPESLRDETAPVEESDPAGRVHAAFFPYQPLRRHGRVRLKDTADSLFESELLDIVPLVAPGKESLVSGICFLRGIAWIAPVAKDP